MDLRKSASSFFALPAEACSQANGRKFKTWRIKTASQIHCIAWSFTSLHRDEILSGMIPKPWPVCIKRHCIFCQNFNFKEFLGIFPLSSSDIIQQISFPSGWLCWYDFLVPSSPFVEIFSLDFCYLKTEQKWVQWAGRGVINHIEG